MGFGLVRNLRYRWVAFPFSHHLSALDQPMPEVSQFPFDLLSLFVKQLNL